MPAHQKSTNDYADTSVLTRLQELAAAPDETPAPKPESGEFISPQAFLALKAECLGLQVRVKELEGVVGRLARHLGLGYAPE